MSNLKFIKAMFASNGMQTVSDRGDGVPRQPSETTHATGLARLSRAGERRRAKYVPVRVRIEGATRVREAVKALIAHRLHSGPRGPS